MTKEQIRSKLRAYVRESAEEIPWELDKMRKNKTQEEYTFTA